MLSLSSDCTREVRIVINVMVPAVTPHDAEIFIAGNHSDAGDWNPRKIKLEEKSESHWRIELRFPKGYYLEFKITRGSWSNEAIYTEGEIPPNNRIEIVSDTSITLYPLTWKDKVFGVGSGVVGTVKYHRELRGEGLKHPRDIIVWLPPSYEKNPMQYYPVLYMHDGQNIIDPATSFIGYDWHVDEVTDSLIRTNKMKEIIIVGIYNSSDRADEYDDTKLGKAYMNFIVNQIKPLIDTTYRTLIGRENTAVMGSSMGGLISFLLVWNYPEVFSKAACVSPLFRPILTRTVENYKGQDKKLMIYIDNGGVGLDTKLQSGCNDMVRSLQNIGFIKGKNIEWFFDSQAEHNERWWAKRVWKPLLFMFGNH